MKRKKKEKNKKTAFAGCDSQCLLILCQKKKQALFKLRYIKDAMLRKKEKKKSKLKDREVKRKKETDKQTDRQTDRRKRN